MELHVQLKQHWIQSHFPISQISQKTGWNQWSIDLQAFADQGVNLSNVNSITLGLNSVSGGTGTMFFDDIRLYPPPPAPEPDAAVNLLSNGSFEEDEAILGDPDWYQWCTWNPAEGAGSNVTIVDTDASDGTRSLRIEPVGIENWHFILVNISFPADLNKNYTASLWAKAEATRPLTVQMKASDNSVDAWGATDFDLTTDWAEYQYTSEVLHTDVKLEFLCAGSEVPFLLDQVSVYEAD